MGFYPKGITATKGQCPKCRIAQDDEARSAGKQSTTLIPGTAEGGEYKRFAFAHAVKRNQVVIVNSGVVATVQLHQFANAAFENGKAGIPRRRFPLGLLRNFDYMLAFLCYFAIHNFTFEAFSVFTSTNIES